MKPQLEHSFFFFFFAGQIELYTHLPVMKQLVEQLQQWEFRVCGVFLVDSQFMVETFKVTDDLASSELKYTWCNYDNNHEVSHLPSSLTAVHLRSHGCPECHGGVRDPSNKHHDKNGPAQSQGQEGDWKVSLTPGAVQKSGLFINSMFSSGSTCSYVSLSFSLGTWTQTCTQWCKIPQITLGAKSSKNWPKPFVVW